MIERRIDISNHFNNSKPFFIKTLWILLPCVLIYFIYQDMAIIYIAGGFVLILALPTCLIHYNHYTNDKRKHILIDIASKSMQFNKGAMRQTVKFSDIESIIYTRGIYDGKSILHKYSYFQFNLKNIEVIYLTSLLLKENDISFGGKTYRTAAFPNIKYIEPKRTTTEIGSKQKE